MTFSNLAEQIANGLIIGSIYALLGSGLALIYGTMRILHFSHGEFYMLGGYFTFFLISQYDIPAVAAIPLAALAVFLLAALIQRIALAPLMRFEGWQFSTIAVTLGLSIALQQIALLLWGERYQSLPYYVEGIVDFGIFQLPLQRILIFVVALVTIGAMTALLNLTRFGRAVRATAQDPEAAAVLGVPAQHIHTLTFALGCALASVGASMLAPVYAINPWMGTAIVLKAFVIVILGGLGSFPGAILAGLLLGVVESIGIAITSSEWRDVIGFVLVILVVWLKPEGLMGTRERRA